MPRFKTNKNTPEYDDIESSEEQEVKPKVNNAKPKEAEQKIIEREINLQLLNDKLNYIIARLEEFE